MSTEQTQGAWLTQESYDRLKAELEHLEGPGRAEIAQRIEDARSEGDLKENGGYHAAKEDQGKAEARIRQLTQLLETAQVGEAPKDDGIVEPGMLITASLGGSEEEFLLGSREIAGDMDIHVYSDKSPLGSAINGHKAGDTVSFEAPNGKTVEVKILKAVPFKG
ncbi:transcription elongation factor GreA [Falsarthrobacter nasiphocae]|uniref:Transcription elongation factor GreA n=1 Tax=Falsarthrobacter nasiphocae TaxID=189863 RepID=A0AAE3YGC4_9MICC|nr:transcription elongation factor GreA [Falsarthrobacter nasiphocae]MDR6891649.1 transcription elongation factor GreA [Falsarthrobacter nasiphocae]